ncbi:MAG: alanine--tRNA ligase [Proteobacteria bacterium]|nr:alanine--tRNA ligase [Pseudomonadota bacterium]
MKTTNEIRRAFLDYFQANEHLVIKSGPLVPGNDPTLMFANAGMVQFKNIFIGEKQAPGKRATTVQKCIRISGKHNDLENVGRTSRHHTFFEMLGNFSFGDYFKEGAIRFAWEFLTDVLQLDRSRLWVSIFAGDDNAPLDDEALAIWRDKIGVPEERILRGSAEDNFWSMGDTGPCGPCSEIMYDRGEAFGEAALENGERFFEIWNLVFMQYMVDTPGGPMQKLPAPCIDTGAGLERLASVLQNVDANYDTDQFVPLIALGAELAGKTYGDDPEDDVSIRVIADHARMAAHCIAEGIFPEKSAREYVLRRVMRRAIRHGHRLGIRDIFFYKVVDRVVAQMQEAYPELAERRALIEKVCHQEEKQFRMTLDRGLELIANNTTWKDAADGQRQLPGHIAFDLSATYGFPLDLLEVIGEEQGFGIDHDGVAEAEAAHRSASGAGKIGNAAIDKVYLALHNRLQDTVFTGYNDVQGEARAAAIVQSGLEVSEATAGQDAEVVLDVTPCYAESGGQVGDTGELQFPAGTLQIADTIKPVAGLIVHRGRVTAGRIQVGDAVQVQVDVQRRKDIARHHTATHLLHWAIRTTLGSHATQKGSRVANDGLRFDFSHFEPLSPAELDTISRLVNLKILENHPVQTTETTADAAKAQGAMAIFEENYGDVVRMVSVSEDSRELCGGTHVVRSGDIGPCYIISEGGIAAGVRRIEAVCGRAAIDWYLGQSADVAKAAAALKTSPSQLVPRVEKLLAHERDLLKEIERLKREMANAGGATETVRDIKGVKVLAKRLPTGDPATLRDSADTHRQKLGSGVVCLGGLNGDKVALVIAVTPDLTDRLSARELIGQLAQTIGGRGGGRPDLAQAGGTDASKLDEAIAGIFAAIENTEF